MMVKNLSYINNFSSRGKYYHTLNTQDLKKKYSYWNFLLFRNYLLWSLVFETFFLGETLCIFIIRLLF